jgi:hypothetical protein
MQRYLLPHQGTALRNAVVLCPLDRQTDTNRLPGDRRPPRCYDNCDGPRLGNYLPTVTNCRVSALFDRETLLGAAITTAA